MPTRLPFGALLADFTHRLAARWHAGRPSALDELDAHALADIGVGAGEIPSILAEARGEAQRTRRRIVEAGHA